MGQRLARVSKNRLSHHPPPFFYFLFWRCAYAYGFSPFPPDW
jgi:hypothetical protein